MSSIAKDSGVLANGKVTVIPALAAVFFTLTPIASSDQRANSGCRQILVSVLHFSLVWGKTGNVTVAHFGFNDEYRNLSFFLQHYVGILTAGLLIAVIAVAAVIRFRTRKKEYPWLETLT